MALNAGANQYTYLTYNTKKCFITAAAAGYKGRQARPMSSLLIDI